MYVDTMANENTTKYTPTVSGAKSTVSVRSFEGRISVLNVISCRE